jgi:UDP-glucose 4-epimerase
MRVLFTGASSFTGLWFARELARAGNDVVAIFRRRPEEYPDALRRERVSRALEVCRGVFGCSFGDARFIDIVGGERWDLLCHHAAEVTDYKSAAFDPVGALASNTRNVKAVVDALQRQSPAAPRVLLTGSVFENDEGAGSEGLPAFSPYGLSKSLTFQVFRYYALRAGLSLGKFVISNPFGPYEEARFTAYLMKAWFAGQAAAVNTPAYVRDNIHVSLLARAYARFAAELPERGLSRLGPSGYAESQGAFTLRVAAAIRQRLGLACEVQLATQTAFIEPRVRINTDIPDAAALNWDEGAAWDEFAAFYRERRGS